MTLLACGCLAALPSAANGDLLFPGDHTPLPDINSAYLTATYDGSSGDLSVIGFQLSYNRAIGPASNIPFDDYNLLTLTAKLSPSSGTPMDVADGSVVISGTVDDLSGPLLTGIVDRVGSQPVAPYGANLDFSFHITGGSLADAFGGIGATACTAVNLWGDVSNGDVAFTGSFHDSFSYLAGANTADTFTVPEPGSAALVLISIIAGMAASASRRCWTRRI
jgi:hypothetical protein